MRWLVFFGPDLAVAGADQLGIDVPDFGHDVDQALARFARGERDRVADHVGLPAGAGVRGFRHARGVVVADDDVLRLDAHLMRGDLRQHGEDALADLGDAGDHLGAAAVVDLGPGAGAIDRRVRCGRSRTSRRPCLVRALRAVRSFSVFIAASCLSLPRKRAPSA